jgi:hypothetical protein
LRFRGASQLKPTSSVVDIKAHVKGRDPGGKPIGESIRPAEGRIVPTFTVTDCAAAPLICTDEFDKVHVGPAVTDGVIAQLKFTVPLNLPDPAKLRLKLAVWPALTV